MQPPWLAAPPPQAPTTESWSACGWLSAGGGLSRVLFGIAGPWVYAEHGPGGQGGAIVFMLLLALGVVAGALGVFDVILGIATLAKPAHGTGTRVLFVVSSLLGLVLHAVVALLGLLLTSDLPVLGYALLGAAFVGALGNVAALFLLPKRAPA